MLDLQSISAELASSANIDWKKLEGSSVLVTGATGLIGTHCIRFLLERNRQFDAGIRVIAMVRNKEKAQVLLDGYGENDGLSYVVADLLDELPQGLHADYVIHAGCPTASSFFKNNPVETSRSIVDGTLNMLEFARSCKCRSFVYVSSMEVYGMGNETPGLSRLLKEEDVGYVDPMQVRSCYPEGKRMAENYCKSYASEYGVPTKVVRLAQTFGPGIPKDDRRIFADFVRRAHNGEDIVLLTTGESTRMYLYTDDAVMALFTVLLNGEKGVAYNAANPETYSSVKDMAEMAANMFGEGKMGVIVDVDPDAPYPPEHHLPLDVTRLKSLGWEPTFDLVNMLNVLDCYLF